MAEIAVFILTWQDQDWDETINYFKQSPEQNRIESSAISVIKKTKKAF